MEFIHLDVVDTGGEKGRGYIGHAGLLTGQGAPGDEGVAAEGPIRAWRAPLLRRLDQPPPHALEHNPPLPFLHHIGGSAGHVGPVYQSKRKRGEERRGGMATSACHVTNSKNEAYYIGKGCDSSEAHSPALK